MSNQLSNNRRIAKNTMYLYIRMLFTLCINLYTSRLLLQYLGIEDFGIYNVVGGIVALMMFVNTSMRGATSRFISYCLGRGDVSELKGTINSSIQIHSAIAILLLLAGETIGLWFVNTGLNLPSSSMYAANCVYQFSLLASAVAILQVPYNACVISYERMNVFAVIEIINVMLKCLIIFCLVLFPNRLIAYGGLLFGVSILVWLMYLVYCHKKINNFSCNMHINKGIVRRMLNFALCDLFGNGTCAVKQQGINILINNFFSVALNAASGVATQASSIISTFMANVLQAFRPQIIKEYSVGNVPRMSRLMCTECDALFFLLALIFVPLYINIDYVMLLWLKTVPPYAVVFCKVLLVLNVFSIATQILQDGIHATGNIRGMSFFLGGLNLFCLLLTYLFFKAGMDAQFAYIAMVICLFIQTIACLVIQKRLIAEYPILNYVKCIVKGCLVLLLCFLIVNNAPLLVSGQFAKVIVDTALSALLLIAIDSIVYPAYRKRIWSLLKNKIR